MASFFNPGPTLSGDHGRALPPGDGSGSQTRHQCSGTPFITRPRAKKKPRGPTEESRPKQNLLVHPRAPPHRQVDAILPAASSTLERASELIDESTAIASCVMTTAP